jgi:hypothetical protein
MSEYPFPPVEYESVESWVDLPQEATDYIAYLETKLGEYELLAERLNTDRVEAHRSLQMGEYLKGMRREC